MKSFLVGLAISGFALGAAAAGSHEVRGYTRSDGTYVDPHYQTNPNETRNDNWSTKGNVNPYTGQFGTRAPDTIRPYSPAPRYEAPRGQSSYGHDKPNPSGSSYGTPDPNNPE